MKKVTAILITAVMLMTSLASVVYGENYLDPMNNDLFEVVAPVTDAAASNSGIVEETMGDYFDNGDEIPTGIIHSIIYQDGSYVKKTITNVPEGYTVELPEGTAFKNPEGRNLDEYVLVKKYDEAYSDNGHSYTENRYKATSQNGAITGMELAYVVEYRTDYETLSYTVYSATEKDGEIVKGAPTEYTEAEYNVFMYGYYNGKKYYNDGLIYDDDYNLADINGQVHFYNGQFSYYSSDYNIGYNTESYNNGGIIDWSLPNPEQQRRFETIITNMFGNGTYSFENTRVRCFNDDGYAIMELNSDGNNKPYVVKLKKPAIITVLLDGEKIKFDQIPVAEAGRTLVPLRAIFDALGAEVGWDGNTQTVTAKKGDTEISLTLGNTTATKNGEAIILDVPAKAISGRTLVPVRFVADCFGVDADWNGAMQQVILTSK